VTTLTEFLLARIAEDEEDIDGPLGVCDDWSGAHYTADRIRAECEVKRRIVKRHYEVPASDIEWSSCPVCRVTWPCPDLRALVSVYDPDYREEWRR